MDFKRLGGLWKRQTKKGEPFLSGSILIDGKEVKIMIFKAREKKTEKSPDYSVVQAPERPQGANTQVQYAKPQESQTVPSGGGFYGTLPDERKQQPVSAQKPLFANGSDEAEIRLEDIPF